MQITKRQKAFSALFLIEMWERFGYYGMAALLVMFMAKALGYTEATSNSTWGAFGAMVYATPFIGGLIGDKILGTRRTTVIGAIVLALGYALLSIPGEHFTGAGHSIFLNWIGLHLFFIALGVIAVGNGLFKANPNNLVSKLYEGEPSSLDSAFTIYYMSINIGSLISMFLTPIIAHIYGWHWAFAVCVFGLFLGLSNYSFMRRFLKDVGSPPDFQPFPWRKFVAVIAGGIVAVALVAWIVGNQQVARIVVICAAAALAGIFIYMLAHSDRESRGGILAVVILTAQGILFFIFYQQMSTSLTFFAEHNVQLNFYGFHWQPEQLQDLNPFWIVVLSPLLAWLYTWLGKRRGDFSVATKFAIGFAVIALGFGTYAVSTYAASPGAKVSSWFLVWGYFFQSLGELLISGLGLAMVARFVSQELRGFVMGGWFLATGIAQYAGTQIANIASPINHMSQAVALMSPAIRRRFATLPVPLQKHLNHLTLDQFTKWTSGKPLVNNPIPAFSKLPPQLQDVGNQIQNALPKITLPLYIRLFLILALVAVAGAILSFALIPLLKRLAGARKIPTEVELAPEHEGAEDPRLA